MTSGVRSGNGLVTISYAMPEITAVVTAAPNANGWHNANVAVTFNGFNPGGPAVAFIGWSTVGTQSFQLIPGWFASVPVSAERQTTAAFTEPVDEREREDRQNATRDCRTAQRAGEHGRLEQH